MKVKLEYITNHAARKVSFTKRKASIMKKVSELSTLCGIEAAAIVYSSPSDPHPEVWPDSARLQQVIEKYQANLDLKKTLNQEGLIQQRINKAKELLKKQSNENHEEEMTQLMLNSIGGQLKENMSMEDLIDMKKLVEQNLRKINMKMEALDKEVEEFYVPTPPASDGLIINGENEKLVDQILEFGMDSASLNQQQWWNEMVNFEDYKGIGADEMLLPFSNVNDQNASSSNNLFSP